MNPPRLRSLALAFAGLVAAGVSVYWAARVAHRRHPGPPPGHIYTSQGFGGYVPAGPPARPDTGKPADPLQPLLDAYNAGRYAQAEALAQKEIARRPVSGKPAERHRAARARLVQAFAAARRKDLALARQRFAALQVEAAALPGGGKQEAPVGQVEPSLQEEAAYQHAVCTAALGDTRAAESEYVAFMARYPESPLVPACTKRIARFHGGNVPKEAQAAYQHAIAAASRQGRGRDHSLCAPECLAELLRRRRRSADTHALAAEMATTQEGTTLAAFVKAARKRGLQAHGMALTQKGLAAARLPVVALVSPGHLVIVERVSAGGVTVWDPDRRGPGRPASRSYTPLEWRRDWHGIAVLLR